MGVCRPHAVLCPLLQGDANLFQQVTSQPLLSSSHVGQVCKGADIVGAVGPKTSKPSQSMFQTWENGTCQVLWVLCLGEKEEEVSTDKAMPDLGCDI